MAQARILVVDDQPNLLRSVERILASRYALETARTPTEALKLLEPFRPDLAILDIRMPEMDGFELMGLLREHDPGLDVIFMTGAIHELDAQLIRSIREKAFYFIQKPFDREVLLTVVDRCLELRRLAAENQKYVRRLEDELNEARNFQQSMLPESGASFEGLSLAGSYLPCEALGGDFYDFARAEDGRAALLIADVSGHGVSAAMLTSVVKSAFHDAYVDGFRPGSVVRRVARGIRPFDAGKFVTVFCASLQDDRLEYVNAGHPAGLLRRANQGLAELERTGPLVSPAFPDADWETACVDFRLGDQLLLYTDGIPEARGEEGFFGEERLGQLFEQHRGPGETLLDSILSEVREFCGGRPSADDWTMVNAWRTE